MTIPLARLRSLAFDGLARDGVAVGIEDPDVMFQDIRYEGLIGHAFLRRFTVTFDIPARRLVFS